MLKKHYMLKHTYSIKYIIYFIILAFYMLFYYFICYWSHCSTKIPSRPHMLTPKLLSKYTKFLLQFFLSFFPGKMEELNVEVDSYHFDTLYERFSYLPGAVKQNEFKTACVAAKAGFIILIVDANGFSIFLPDVFSIYSKYFFSSIYNFLFYLFFHSSIYEALKL